MSLYTFIGIRATPIPMQTSEKCFAHILWAIRPLFFELTKQKKQSHYKWQSGETIALQMSKFILQILGVLGYFWGILGVKCTTNMLQRMNLVAKLFFWKILEALRKSEKIFFRLIRFFFSCRKSFFGTP